MMIILTMNYIGYNRQFCVLRTGKLILFLVTADLTTQQFVMAVPWLRRFNLQPLTTETQL
jgi:hypothetical protein